MYYFISNWKVFYSISLLFVITCRYITCIQVDLRSGEKYNDFNELTIKY